MTVRESQNIIDSGIVPFAVLVRMFRNGDELGLGPSAGVLAEIQRVVRSYEPSQNEATLMMWDPNSVDQTTVTPQTIESMPIPQQGDEFLITCQDSTDMLTLTAGGTPNPVIFRGIITSISEQNTDSGLRYVVTCKSMENRLNEKKVTLQFNTFNDPIHPSPVFDPNSGTQVQSRTILRTVADIIKSIMAFQDAWGTPDYLAYTDIIWPLANGTSMETDIRCGAFVPRSVSYVNTGKIDAIQQVLDRAGNFKIYYDPSTTDTGKLRIVELNKACNRCGPLWDLSFPIGSSDSGQGEGYATELDVISDATVWNTDESCNVLRITSSQIRFYTGQYIIPETIENGQKDDPNHPGHSVAATDVDRFVAVEQDSIANQKARAVNQDGVNYRFQHPIEQVFSDPRKIQQYPVGLPLFPDWNPHEDFLPETKLLVGVMPVENQTALPNNLTPDSYKWEYEFLRYTQGQSNAMGVARLGRSDNLRVYQAWYVKDKCPACHGSGNVAKVYTNDTNTPVITWVPMGAPVSITGQAGGTQKQIMKPVASNYIMSPLNFGDPNYDPVAAGLRPWAPSGDNLYPIPSRNLCPYCRGVGWKPDHKLRNFESSLVEARTVTTTATDHVNEVPIDAEFTQTEAETWEQTQNRLIIPIGAYVQLEDAIITQNRLPVAPTTNGNLPWQQLAGVEAFSFPHPLNGYRFKLCSKIGIQDNDPTGNLVPADWNALGMFTTIRFAQRISQSPTVDLNMGRVVFGMPVFIPAEMNWARPATSDSQYQYRIILDANGLTRQIPQLRRANGIIPVGYWRPARAWLQGFYTKDRFYSRPKEGEDGFQPVQFQFTNADGETKNFQAKAMVVDGCWVCEITRFNPTSWGIQPSNPTDQVELITNRVIQMAIDDDEAKIETTEDDLKVCMIPPRADMTPNDLETYKRNAGCAFPRARVFRWDTPSAGEGLYEMEGIDPAVAQNAFARPRLYSWRLRDDRSKLMNIGCRKLDEANNIRVTGSLIVKGRSVVLNTGLGYVNYPNKGPTAAMRVVYNFSNGFKIEIEVSKQVARFGEIPYDNKVSITDLKNELTNLKRNLATASQYTPPHTTSGGGIAR